MAGNGPWWRYPWTVAALVLLLVSLLVILFGPLTLGLILMVAGQTANLVAIRRASVAKRRTDRLGAQDPGE